MIGVLVAAATLSPPQIAKMRHALAWKASLLPPERMSWDYHGRNYYIGDADADWDALVALGLAEGAPIRTDSVGSVQYRVTRRGMAALRCRLLEMAIENEQAGVASTSSTS